MQWHVARFQPDIAPKSWSTIQSLASALARASLVAKDKCHQPVDRW